MKVNEELLLYLEELSRLKLDETEKAGAMDDLTNILNFTEQLQGLHTDNVPALSHPFHDVNTLRDDAVTSVYHPEDILKNAPDRRNTYFKVHKTVE